MLYISSTYVPIYGTYSKKYIFKIFNCQCVCLVLLTSETVTPVLTGLSLKLTDVIRSDYLFLKINQILFINFKAGAGRCGRGLSEVAGIAWAKSQA